MASSSEPSATGYRRPLSLWGGTIGFGLGAVVDVVLFHLVVQHHHLLSGYVDPSGYEGVRANVFYDGIFLAAMLGVTAIGAGLLWRTVNGAPVRFSGRYLGGAIVVGAGAFNVVDGVVTHYVLGAHDVVHDTAAWNPHWVVVSVGLLALGIGLLARADGPVDAAASTGERGAATPGEE